MTILPVDHHADCRIGPVFILGDNVAKYMYEDMPQAEI
jgi:hypothetical protein